MHFKAITSDMFHLLVQLDLVKTRQQCGAQQAIPMIVASVIRENGAGGLFSGLVSDFSSQKPIAQEYGQEFLHITKRFISQI